MVQRNYKNASYGDVDQTGWAKTKIIGQCGTFMKKVEKFLLISLKIKGPKNMFEISSAAGEGSKEISH